MAQAASKATTDHKVLIGQHSSIPTSAASPIKFDAATTLAAGLGSLGYLSTPWYVGVGGVKTPCAGVKRR
jgi:hypothetical protein